MEKNVLKFLVVDDYTDIPVWDDLIFEGMLSLKSKPCKGWEMRTENTLPEGEWILANGMYPLATVDAYSNFGVRKPRFDELPVVFCVRPDGTVEERRNVTVEQIVEFIAARI